MWYIAFLPLIFPQTSLAFKWKGVAMIVAWLGGEVRTKSSVYYVFRGTALTVLLLCLPFLQLHWLFWAYHLEMQGVNTFFSLWIAGLIFFSVNVGILAALMRHHSFTPLFHKDKVLHLVPSSRGKLE